MWGAACKEKEGGGCTGAGAVNREGEVGNEELLHLIHMIELLRRASCPVLPCAAAASSSRCFSLLLFELSDEVAHAARISSPEHPSCTSASYLPVTTSSFCSRLALSCDSRCAAAALAPYLNHTHSYKACIRPVSCTRVQNRSTDATRMIWIDRLGLRCTAGTWRLSPTPGGVRESAAACTACALAPLCNAAFAMELGPCKPHRRAMTRRLSTAERASSLDCEEESASGKDDGRSLNALARA